VLGSLPVSNLPEIVTELRSMSFPDVFNWNDVLEVEFEEVRAFYFEEI
jgi:hypothetical protein